MRFHLDFVGGGGGGRKGGRCQAQGAKNVLNPLKVNPHTHTHTHTHHEVTLNENVLET